MKGRDSYRRGRGAHPEVDVGLSQRPQVVFVRVRRWRRIRPTHRSKCANQCLGNDHDRPAGTGHVVRRGGFADVDMVYDVKTFTVYGGRTNLYAQKEIAGNLDALNDALRDDTGPHLSAGDLLHSDVAAGLTSFRRRRRVPERALELFVQFAWFMLMGSGCPCFSALSDGATKGVFGLTSLSSLRFLSGRLPNLSCCVDLSSATLAGEFWFSVGVGSAPCANATAAPPTTNITAKANCFTDTDIVPPDCDSMEMYWLSCGPACPRLGRTS